MVGAHDWVEVLAVDDVEHRSGISTGGQTVLEIGSLLRSGAVTCRSLTEQALVRAEIAQSRTNAFITLMDESALTSATALDDELRAGRDRGPLHGVPFVHKDIFDTAGTRTTIGSRLFSERTPKQDAAVVSGLRNAGGICIGKTNMSECAAGLSGHNDAYGDVRNGYDTTRLAGGSSGGTAAAISSGVCLVGTGTDTGGSIRAPAAYNGIVGLRPTRGLIELGGAFPRAQTFDVAGPMGRSVVDVAALLTGMSGCPRPDYVDALSAELPSTTIGVVRGWSDSGLDQYVQRHLSTALETITAIGIGLAEVSFDMRRERVFDAALSILSYEFASNIHNISGIRTEAFGETVRRDLEEGQALAPDAYRKALDFRHVFATEMMRLFDQVDFLVSPTMPATAPAVAADAETSRDGRLFLLPASLAGLPAISIPCGRERPGLPVGLQLIGPPLCETRMLQVAAAFERACTGAGRQIRR